MAMYIGDGFRRSCRKSRHPEVVKPETVTAWKVLKEDMSSIYADGVHGVRIHYELGQTSIFPDSAPAIAFVHFEDALEYLCDWSGAGIIIRAQVTVAHPTEPPFEPDGGGEKVWCSSITPIAVVNEDGTEEGAEHRVVVRADQDDWLLNEDGLHIAAICRVVDRGFSFQRGARYTLTGPIPEPEPERVVPELFHTERTYRCPKCKCPLKEKDIHGGCCACGVLFEEVPDA